MKSVFVFLCLFFSFTSFANPTLNHYSYNVRVPSSDTSCADQATALAKSFAQFDSKLQDVKGVCVGTSTITENAKNYALNSLSVDYASMDELPVLPFTAALQEDLLAGESITAVYASYHECVNDLTNQENQFVAATGLPVLAVSCESEESDPEYGYKMILSALGTPKASLYQFSNSADESVITNPTWAGQVKALLVKNGAQIVKQAGEVYYYYAARALSASSQTLIATNANADCEAQIPQAKALFTKLGGKQFSATCHTNELGHTMDILSDVYSATTGDLGAGSAIYYDFASCMNELVREQNQDIANKNTSEVLFCSANDITTGQYDIESFPTRF